MADNQEKISTRCPACGQWYQVTAAGVGRLARCKCGQMYRVGAVSAATAVPTIEEATPVAPLRAAQDASVCVNHPEVPATCVCARCRQPICDECEFPRDDGSHVCTDCVGWPSATPSETTPGRPAPRELPPSFPSLDFGRLPPGTMCRQHPEMAATARCQKCDTPVCDTCDFQFPGDQHFCPTCVTSTSSTLGQSRKQCVGWALAAAVVTTLLMGLLLGGVLAEMAETEPGSTFVGIMIMIPGLLGTGLAFGSLDSRAGNPPIVWVAVVWNSLLIGAFILLCIVGAMMGA